LNSEIKAQPGPQSQFLATKADIAIFGGAAGAGKSWALLAEPLRHVLNGKVGAVIFRRNSTQVRNEGGLWDEACDLYPQTGGIGTSHNLTWVWPSGMTVSMRHMDNESDRFAYQGSQIPILCFDEITHFTERQFWYMLARNRSMSGVPSYIRATCNPDPDSFVARLIEWWIDPVTGYAINERSGLLRWFVRCGDDLDWFACRASALEKHPGSEPKSLTFIRSSVYDNKILLASDPAYLSNLKSLPLVEREQLLHGNWKIRAAAGNFFRREWFEIVDAAPRPAQSSCRFWDRAGTKPRDGGKADWTAGVLVSKSREGIFYVEDVVRFQGTPAEVERCMVATATQDSRDTIIGFMQDPGSAGVAEKDYAVRMLAGHQVKVISATGSKETRAKPASSQAENGNIKLVRGRWNHDFLSELVNFPEGQNDDQIDSLSGAVNTLAGGGGGYGSVVPRQDFSRSAVGSRRSLTV